MREKEFKAKDGHRINVYCWEEVERPSAVLQIFHGMAEHAGRYDRFARELNTHGIVVFADDHRGHGKTAVLNGKYGDIGQNGFYNIVEDEKMISDVLKKEYCGIPLFIFAHSFGSFIAQDYITKYSREIDGVILCGSAAQDSPQFRFAKLLAWFYVKLFGEENRAKFLHQLSFKNFNKRVDPSDNSNWLSRDSNEVKKYNEDEACGFVCSNGFYYYFMDGLVNLYKRDKLGNIQKDLPIYIIAGQEDPVGGYGKKASRLYDIYRRQNISDLRIKLYRDSRHELLNELNREEVIQDIMQWINDHRAQREEPQ